MTGQKKAALLFLLGGALSSCSHATEEQQLHLRKRNDPEEATLALEFEREEQEIFQGVYENVTQFDDYDVNEEPTMIEKIDMCFGDCDTSDDCMEGLFCYHRDLDDPLVPGCTDDENPYLSTTNSVCIPQLPEDYNTWERTSPIKSTRNLIGLCRGDCDRDSECDGNLVCHQRNRGQAVPGCRGKSLASSRDYCVRPKQAGRKTGGGNNNKNEKLGECEGDCNSDQDCAAGLVCKQRNAFEALPSGCKGRLRNAIDYCVKPGNTGNTGGNTSGSNTPSTTTSTPAVKTSGSFRLKIYWQPGYDWQGEYFERKWCLARDYNVGGTCWAGLRRMRCGGDQVFVTKCSGSSRQQWTYQYVGSGEVLIKATGEDRCLTRMGWHIVLRSCNANSNMQRFYAPRGDLNGRRFELSQKSAPRFCLNQDHHPKNAEYVQMLPCSWNRAWDSLTSYWERV